MASVLKERLRQLVRPAAVFLSRAGLRSSLAPPLKRIIWDWVNKYFAYEGVAGLARTRWDDEIHCDTADFIQKHVYFFGEWEPALTRYIRSLPASDSIFIDVGANIGYFSLLASTRFSCVKAFEASPSIHAKLARNIERNKRSNIEAINVAIGPDRGAVALRAGPPGNIGMASLVQDELDAGDSGNLEMVAMEPLSSFLTREDCARVRLIKIDVEGAEPGVVASLIDLIASMPASVELVIEITPDEKGDVQRMFDRLCSLGFKPFVLAGAYRLEDYLDGQVGEVAAAADFPEIQSDILFRRQSDPAA